MGCAFATMGCFLNTGIVFSEILENVELNLYL